MTIEKFSMRIRSTLLVIQYGRPCFSQAIFDIELILLVVDLAEISRFRFQMLMGKASDLCERVL